MVPEAPLEPTEHGLVPAGDGWFVLNARETRWWDREGRGAAGDFDGEPEFPFPQLGIAVYVLGRMAMYHWEADQEDFLVVSGEALLIVEGEERPLQAWDFVHCPPETKHVIVGVGDGPCVVVEDARRRTTEWFGSLQPFEPRVNLGTVVGHKFPALLSEQDGVIHFARFLNEAGVPWDAIHHQVSVSRWIFDAPHPAATAMTPGERRRRIDLALLRSEDLLAAKLPATEPGFTFDAFLEFAYLSDYWQQPKARIFNRVRSAHARKSNRTSRRSPRTLPPVHVALAT